jgi:hypothetical protein
MTTPGVAITLWMIYGCAAFGAVGSIGPCSFIEMRDCMDRAEIIQKEQSLPIPPSCYEEEVEVWWQ